MRPPHVNYSRQFRQLTRWLKADMPPNKSHTFEELELFREAVARLAKSRQLPVNRLMLYLLSAAVRDR